MRQTADFSGLFTSHLISGPEVTIRDLGLGSDAKYHDLQQNIRSANENWKPNVLSQANNMQLCKTTRNRAKYIPLGKTRKRPVDYDV